jgi:hypothetical protein
MRLVMTLLVSNEEEELLDALLRYHYAQGVSFIMATAHRAPERTLELLDRYARKGKLDLRQEVGRDVRQREWVTGMARRAASDFEADWVINADADEFFWPERGTLVDVFAAIPERYHTLACPLCHFVPQRTESGFFADRMVIRETVSRKKSGWFGAGISDAEIEAKLGVPASELSARLARGAQIEFKTAHRARPDIVVGGGNHRVRGEGLVPVPAAWRPVTVLHFPMRRYDQYEAKIVQKGRAARNSPHHVLRRHLYSLYEQGRLRAYYEDQLVDRTELEAGVRAGRLVIDHRLRRFLADLRTSDSGDRRSGSSDERPDGVFSDTGGPLAWPDEPRRVAELRAELARTLYGREFDPLTRRVQALQGKLCRDREQRRRLRRKVRHFRAKARRRKKRITAIESSIWSRAGARVRRLGRRARSQPTKPAQAGER